MNRRGIESWNTEGRTFNSPEAEHGDQSVHHTKAVISIALVNTT
jgi:hypothetical protein